MTTKKDTSSTAKGKPSPGKRAQQTHRYQGYPPIATPQMLSKNNSMKLTSSPSSHLSFNTGQELDQSIHYSKKSKSKKTRPNLSGYAPPTGKAKLKGVDISTIEANMMSEAAVKHW